MRNLAWPLGTVAALVAFSAVAPFLSPFWLAVILGGGSLALALSIFGLLG